MSKKYYIIGAATAELFNEVHTELTIGSLISRNVECVDIMEHSPTRGEYLLHKYEAAIVDGDDRINFINLSPARYPEIYNATPEDLWGDINGTDYNRYGETVKHWQNSSGSTTFNGSATDITDKGRESNQLIRCKQKRNPWIISSTNERDVIEKDPVQKGAGENVDIIVADDGTWIGHVEFINPNGVNFTSGDPLSPSDYVGGNVLPGNGYCDVLDIIMDGPYYIDPDWFNADPTNRLMTRWDGTIVPTEQEARNWWANLGNANRSSAFLMAGSVIIFPSYTRANAHGSNTEYPASGTHGTQCGSQIFGRNHGWAYNANKWHINLYGYTHTGIDRGFDVQKIFHENKPVNPLYGTKDPTISSNSWGLRANKSANYYYFQSATGTAYNGSGYEPEFMKYMGLSGDSGRWKSEMYDNALTEAGKELVDSGVIFVVAAGNSGQMQVNPDDPNYDNHISNGANDGVYSSSAFNTIFGYSVTGTTNRRGFPQHIGKTESQTSQGNLTVKFPAINIGALDDQFLSGKERKVVYSDTGNAIDLYFPADGTLGACVGDLGSNNTTSTNYQRFDNSYAGLLTPASTNPYYSRAADCRDVRFSGTSSACPIAAGFLATVLQYNRGWTYEDMRSWIQTNIQPQASADFHQPARGTTANGSEWSDRNNLQGGVARVGYLASHPITTPHPNATATPDPVPDPGPVDPDPDPDPDPGPSSTPDGLRPPPFEYPAVASYITSDLDRTLPRTDLIPPQVEIFANFDTTTVSDPEKEYYNLPKNKLSVLNQITASTKISIIPNAVVDKLVFTTTGIDGYGYNDETFNFDKTYFQNQIIYFTARIKTVTNYPAKYLNNLSLGDGNALSSVKIELLDENDNTLAVTISSNFGELSSNDKGGAFKGAFQYNGIGNNFKLKGLTKAGSIINQSNNFNIIPVSGTRDFRKINEDNNQKDNFLNYLYQPNLKNNPKFFTDIIGQIVGDEKNPNTLGVKVYEKISNFLINSNDIEYANIDNLISSLKLIDSNVNTFSEQYPASLKRIVDFFSVNRSKIKPIKNNFNQDFNNAGRPSSDLGKNLGNKISLSDTLSGGDNYRPIVAYGKFSQRYYLLNTDPTSSFDFRYLGDNKTFQISSYNTNWGWGLDLPNGVGDFTYMLNASGDNLVLENGFRILNEEKGESADQITNYYTFFEYISTINNSNIYAFYDDTNAQSTCDLTTLSSINDSINEIILKDIYTGSKLI